jgi:DNA-binding MarR family transcriptional regulator
MPDTTTAPDETAGLYFAIFTEIGILSQLSARLLEARLPAGLLVSHFGVLNHLSRVTDGCTPLDLAHAFQVPKTTMTHTLAGLDRHGLVDMRPNPGDKRSKQVWLTDAGKRLRAEVLPALAPDIASIAAQLPTEQAASLLPALTALREVLDRMRDTSQGPPGPSA